MNRDLVRLKILFVVVSFQFFTFISIAQEKTVNTILTNNDVVDMVKAGLSEDVILAKIKNSKCEFNTSSEYLIKLKENGVSDKLITAMIEANPTNINLVERTKTSSNTPLEMKDAIGKNKVFVETEDEKSQLAIIKIVKEKGFVVVTNKQDAELLVKFSFQIQTSTAGIVVVGIFMSNNIEKKIGKLTVYLLNNSEENLIFVKESSQGYVSKYIYKQAESYTKDFIKELKKAENSNKSR